MKTTVEISDSLLAETRKITVRERTTVGALVDEGLRRVIQARSRRDPFKLRKATFKGKGLQSGMAGASWQKIRDAAYEGRGA